MQDIWTGPVITDMDTEENTEQQKNTLTASGESETEEATDEERDFRQPWQYNSKASGSIAMPLESL